MLPFPYGHETAMIEISNPIFDVPPGTSRPEFAVPTQIRDFMIARYLTPGVPAIDPMMGDAGFPLGAHQQGVICDGIELGAEQYAISVRRLTGCAGVELVHGDCTKVAPARINTGYDIITSPPFVLMDHLANDRPKNYEEEFHWNDLAIAFHRMVRTGGRLIIDSADVAERNGRLLYPAYDTISYFTHFYFGLESIHRFVVRDAPSGCDDQFTELVFQKRWGYRPGSLAA
jgi:hypothetical protein